MSPVMRIVLALCLLAAYCRVPAAAADVQEHKAGVTVESEHEELLESEELVEEADTEDGEEDTEEEEHDEQELEGMSAEQLEHAHSKIDKNKDGLVTLEEALEFTELVQKHSVNKDMNALFAELDANRDGKIQLSEYLKDMTEWEGDEQESKETKAKHTALEKAMFNQADTNKDEALDEAEARALFHPDNHHGLLELAAKATMEEKDTNKDGVLTLEEFARDAEDEHPEPPSKEDEEFFHRLDKNKDGKVDVHELRRWEANQFHAELALHQLFSLADKDHDGHLTAKELSGASESLVGTDAHEHVSSWVDYLFR